MARICLVSCVSEKLDHASPACDLYTSDLFRKAQRYAIERADQWFILSAEHGLVTPEAVTAPYDKTLNAMPVDERRQWAAKVLKALTEVICAGDEVAFLAGDRYREFLVPELEATGVRVRVPMEGLRIGEQLRWLNSAHAQDVERFYGLLDDLSRKLGGPRCLGHCCGRDRWPERGIYFFFEPGEMRRYRPSRSRVVRIGTHAITTGRRSELWGRLAAHRGTASGHGNHRGSIFRKHAGAAIMRRDSLVHPGTWLQKEATRAEKLLERDLERRVSEYLASTTLLWLDVDDAPSPESERATIERNAIALLSQADAVIDPPSRHWLGLQSVTDEIRTSGLWNVQCVGEPYDPAFLDVMERRVTAMKP
jgi:hypothetical protein